MVARTTPIAVKLKPDPPDDDAERLRRLRKQLNRCLAEAARTNAEIIKLEQQQKDAA
ncbi:MAG: hypothetical protein WBA46_04095 [Thermomicrobiales bacterium]